MLVIMTSQTEELLVAHYFSEYVTIYIRFRRIVVVQRQFTVIHYWTITKVLYRTDIDDTFLSTFGIYSGSEGLCL